MKKMIVALMLLASTAAQAGETYCEQIASSYLTARMLHEQNMDDKVIYTAIGLYDKLMNKEREDAVYRTGSSGDLNYMSSKTIYKHVYNKCMRGVTI